ncbi:MAG TPA: RNA polymerase sigma factor [Phycisphaerae bacterium]|nr:RNA polymerase sigma factor [Phycisphaerae bacterium]
MDQTNASRLSENVPRMYRVALRMVGDDDGAGEVVQEACVKALRAMGRFDGRSALSTWLHRITVNCAMDHLRRIERAGGREISLDPDGAALLVSAQPPPSATVDQRETIARMMAHIADLPDDCRCVFVLTQLDGYSYDDAARIAGQPRGTVASRVFRAKKLLLSQLSDSADSRVQA